MTGERRHRLAARSLCVVVAAFIGHFHVPLACDCRQGLATAVVRPDRRPDPLHQRAHNCPVFRLLQSTFATDASVVCADLTFEVVESVPPGEAVIPAARIVTPGRPRAPPSLLA